MPLGKIRLPRGIAILKGSSLAFFPTAWPWGCRYESRRTGFTHRRILNEGYRTEMRPLPPIETVLLRSSSGRGLATGPVWGFSGLASWLGLATSGLLVPGPAMFGRLAFVGLDVRCPLLLL